MAQWLNRTAGIAARNGTSSHTITFSTFGDAPFTPTNGRFLVVIISGAVTMTWPGGWTEQLQPVNNSELSVATITASSTTSVAVTHNGSNYPVQVVVYEFPAGSTWVNGIGSANVPIANAHPTVTSLPGTAVSVFYGVCGARDNATGTCSSVWDSPAIEDYDADTVFATTDGQYLTVAYEDGVTATSRTATLTITNGSNLVAGSSERVTFAIAPGAGAAFIPPPPTLITRQALVRAYYW